MLFRLAVRSRLFRHLMARSALAVGALSAISAHAMTRQVVEMTCPYDGVRFEFSAQASGTSFGQLLDRMQFGAIESPWPLATCPTNGFVFIKTKYEDDELERLRPLILSAEYQNIRNETPYYRAAWIMERSGAAHHDVSRFLLQATWEAGRADLAERSRVDGAPSPTEKSGNYVRRMFAQGTTGERYRRYATELLPRLAVDAADAARSMEERTVSRVLIGELLRRLGRFDEAGNHFVVLASDVAPASKEAALVAFQRQLIAAKDIGLHFMSEAFAQSQGR